MSRRSLIELALFSVLLTPAPACVSKDCPTNLRIYYVEVNGITSSPTPVSLRATDSSGTRILDVSGEIRWEDEECHPKPLDNSI